MQRWLFVALCLAVGFVQAQIIPSGNSFKISGSVVDSLNNSPVYYATIALFPADSSKPINGTITDAKGAFSISGIPVGVYRIEIRFVGYMAAVLNNIQLNSKNPSARFDNIRLKPERQISDVVITANKAAVEFKSDKVVYNAENDLTTQGGTATDVLKKVPEVSVDADGNVELQGNSGIQFLINGKPSSIFGSNVADALKSIPADQIKSIEVIASPGARYDGTGTGGIINIILKNSRLEGINGSVSISGGTRLQTGSVNLNIRKGKVGVHLFASGNGQINSTTLINSSQTLRNAETGEVTVINQTGSNNYKRYGSPVGVGLEWDVTKNDNISINASGFLGGNLNKGPLQQQLTGTDSTGAMVSNTSTLRNTVSNFNFYDIDWSLGYNHQFKTEGQELSFLYSSSYDINHIYYLQTQTYSGSSSPYSGSNSTNPGSDWQTNLQLDYKQPIGKHVLIETGAKTGIEQLKAKTVFNSLVSSTGEYVVNPLQSYNIAFSRNVYAAYVSGSFDLFEHLHLTTGVRYEHTQNKGYFSNASNVTIKPYNTWLPSANISYSFKGNQMLHASYSHRIERPEYRELNPFVNSADPHNLVTGNPLLLPEEQDKVELGYKKSFEKYVSFNINVYYQINSHDIKQPVTYYPVYIVGDSAYTNASVTQFANIGKEQKYGMSAYLSLQTPFKLSFTSNLQLYERAIESGSIRMNGIEYRINGNITYEFPKAVLFEFFLNYNSQRTGLQGKYPSFLSYNFAIRKLLLHDKLSVAFTCTNFFDEYVKQYTVLSAPQFDISTTRKMPYRSFGLSVSYKFGKMNAKKGKGEEDNNNPDNPFE